MRRSMRTSFKMYPLCGGADGRGSQSLLTLTATIYCYFSSHGNRKQCSEQRMVLIMTLLNSFCPTMLLRADLTVPHRAPVPNKFAVPIGKRRFAAENNHIINTVGLLIVVWEVYPRLPCIYAVF